MKKILFGLVLAVLMSHSASAGNKYWKAKSHLKSQAKLITVEREGIESENSEFSAILERASVDADTNCYSQLVMKNIGEQKSKNSERLAFLSNQQEIIQGVLFDLVRMRDKISDLRGLKAASKYDTIANFDCANSRRNYGELKKYVSELKSEKYALYEKLQATDFTSSAAQYQKELPIEPTTPPSARTTSTGSASTNVSSNASSNTSLKNASSSISSAGSAKSR